jgi:hypothetical protein
MANPTTNFGWQMPTATDLVTDLPADFEVFGQAVDTDFVGLKGGTTGQVLAKASGTDLDFVWSADAAGMTNPMTTTGDIIYSSPGSTPVRLGIGSTDDVLTVAGGVPTWAAPSGKVIKLAKAEVGYVEGKSNFNKFARVAGHANNQPWCNTFISAIFIEAGLKKRYSYNCFLRFYFSLGI